MELKNLKQNLFTDVSNMHTNIGKKIVFDKGFFVFCFWNLASNSTFASSSSF